MNRLREKCLAEKKKVSIERDQISEFDLALDLFKENTSRWIEIYRESVRH